MNIGKPTATTLSTFSLFPSPLVSKLSTWRGLKLHSITALPTDNLVITASSSLLKLLVLLPLLLRLHAPSMGALSIHLCSPLCGGPSQLDTAAASLLQYLLQL